MNEKGLTKRAHYAISDGIFWRAKSKGLTLREKGEIRVLFTAFHTIRSQKVDIVVVQGGRVRASFYAWGIRRIANDARNRGLRMMDMNRIRRKISSAEGKW